MLSILFTLDYEIHGSGRGDPLKLMVEPTARLLDELERYGLKLTIMADVAEILRFKEYAEQSSHDRFHYGEIAGQLQDAVRRGHDVQLHLHTSYFNARLVGDQWRQDWSEYTFADLPLEKATRYVRLGKEYLEGLLRPVKADYACVAFRAANWAMQPSKGAIGALVANGLKIDTSVFRFGKREGRVRIDYTPAPMGPVPWRADALEICRPHPEGPIWEMPIYSEARTLAGFLAPGRIWRVLGNRFGGTESDPPAGFVSPSKGAMSLLPKTYAWKADFNQCTSGQLIKVLERAERWCVGKEWGAFVLIGHSKLYDRMNQRVLRGFLRFCAGEAKRFQAGTAAESLPMLEQLESKARGGAGKAGPAYVLVTPARNEERTIGETLASVVNQTVLPREWIIVSDGSTDGTDRLVADYARTYPFIRLLRLEDRPGRSFASVVFATEAGFKALRFQEYQYLGLLDADVRFAPNYFEALMRRMAASPELGLVGGLALDVVDGRPLWHKQNRSEVAGAVQFYRRACWESLGALFPIRQGGWDAVTCLQARANGYATQTFDDIIVEHLKRRNSADGGALAGSWTFGCRDYALGHHPVFEIAKCAERLIEPPLLVGGLVRLIAFFWCCLALRKSLVPESIVAQVRREQMHRLCLSLLRPLGLVRSVKRVATSMEQIESDRMAHVRQP